MLQGLRRNRLRELLKESKPTIGTHLLSTWPGMMEVVGNTGVVDYVEFTSQYAPYDLYALDNLATAADLYGVSTMIKIDPEPRNYLAQRAIGSGFHSVLFADLRTVKEVEEAIQSVRCEPEGSNGTGMNRAVGYFYGGTEEFVRYCKDIVVAVMVEKKSLFDQLEDLMNLDDLQMVQFGSYDFALSLGVPGQPGNPKVAEAMQRTVKMAVKYDKHPRVELVRAEDAQKYMDMGVTDFCVGWDIMIVREFLKQNGTALRKLLGRE